MATIDLGKIAITPEGQWSAGKYYEKLSLVIYNGQSYLSLRNTTGDNPETSRGDWMQITSRGESLYQMMVREGKFVGTEEEFLQQYLDSLKACADASAEVRAALSDILDEMDRVLAEISEVMVEEDIRIKNEAKREDAEINRRNAEITRGVEERNRQEAEQLREQSMQQIQNDAEIALAMAAEAQQKAEEAIVNEEERISAENQRKIDEATRIQHEEQRVNDEAMRRSREADRLESENIRQKNEGDRILAEREREEIMRNLVEELKGLAANKFKIVDVLPEVGEFAVIYLVPSTMPSNNDVYDEWAYVSEKWEHIGSTRFKIDDYFTKEEVERLLATKQNTLTPGNGISIKGNVISSTVDSLITPITYAELVALRDSSSLVAGMQYRITDYDFTTTEEDTDSAHKLFDIIVTADSESILNETARAVHHQYETSVETLTGAIKLYKTDMDGYADGVDTGDYFLLVGTVEVDGVTYYRYDKYEGGANTGRYILLESIDLDSLGVGLDNPLYPVGGGTYGEDGSYVSHSEDAIVAYENGTVTVGSAPPLSNRDIASWELKYTLENTKHSSIDGKGTILWMKDEFRNECNYDFINALFKVYEITACAKSPSLVGTYAIKTGNSNITYGTNSKLASTFGAGNHDNIIKYDGLAKIALGNSCSYNTFGNSCSSNTFGNNCYSNTFGNNCYSNTFGNYCYYNTFGNNCSSNTFGNNCYYNTFGNNCYSNTFGISCSSNTFGSDCYYNTFGNNCSSNTFGNSCTSNTFGNDCYSNTFGNSCSSNTFGNSCSSNTFGNDCYSIKLATSNSAITKYNYYRYNHFGDGCQYILFKGAETASLSVQVQNYNFAQGVQGTSSAYLTIDGVRSRAYETKVAKNSSGELKIYCEADLIQ